MEGTAVAPTSTTAPKRRGDRRAGLHDVVREMATEWLHVRTSPTVDVRTTLAAKLRRVTRARAVQFNEVSGSSPIRLGQPVRARDYIAVAVPGAGDTNSLVLEASFGTEASGDDWACQLLEAAAGFATIILELEQFTRLNGPPSARPADGAAPLIGSSLAMQALRERIERVATTDFTVLIEGESGTGKELVARQVHDLSRRGHGPFVAINCAALVETLLEAELFGIEERTATGVRGRRGKFEHADGGTLFLDEVSELSMAAQAKLLRAIQDLSVERVGGVGARRVDTRIVVATNRSLSALCERGLFRTDLFYRLSGVDVQVAPLRRRKEDILELAHYFLSRHGGRRRLTISAAAADALVSYEWPGNVRELERMIEGAIATCEARQIALDDLPIALRGEYSDVLMPSVQANDTMRAWGSRYARLVLEKCGRNKRRACHVLGISYHTLNAYLAYKGTVRRKTLPAAAKLINRSAELAAAPAEVTVS